MYGDAIGGAHGYFTEGAGLYLIFGQGQMTTPDRRWQHRVDLRRAYPDLTQQGDYYVAETTRDAEYFFATE
jgi:hypothetical protein